MEDGGKGCLERGEAEVHKVRKMNSKTHSQALYPKWRCRWERDADHRRQSGL